MEDYEFLVEWRFAGQEKQNVIQRSYVATVHTPVYSSDEEFQFKALRRELAIMIHELGFLRGFEILSFKKSDECARG